MTEKLKPCPFCGSDSVEISPNVGHLSFFLSHTCRDLLYIDGRARSKAEAIEAWNTRAERKAQWFGVLGTLYGHPVYDHFVCTACDGISEERSAFCPHCGAKMEEENNETD